MRNLDNLAYLVTEVLRSLVNDVSSHGIFSNVMGAGTRAALWLTTIPARIPGRTTAGRRK